MPTASEHDERQPAEGSLPPIIAPPKLTIYQALNFIGRVGIRFQNKPEQYALFLHTSTSYVHAQAVIAEAHARRISLPQGFVIPTIHSILSKCCEILKNEPDLLAEFKVYFQPITANPGN